MNFNAYNESNVNIPQCQHKYQCYMPKNLVLYAKNPMLYTIQMRGDTSSLWHGPEARLYQEPQGCYFESIYEGSMYQAGSSPPRLLASLQLRIKISQQHNLKDEHFHNSMALRMNTYATVI